MGSLKTFALAGAMALGASAAAAADLASAAAAARAARPAGTITAASICAATSGSASNVNKFYQETSSPGGGSSGRPTNHSVFAGVGIGYRFNNWFRFDGTLEYRGAAQIGVSDRIDFTRSPIGIQTNTYKGNLSSMVALFNGYVDLGTWNCLTPYIGAGIGYALEPHHRIDRSGRPSRGFARSPRRWARRQRHQVGRCLGADGRSRL